MSKYPEFTVNFISSCNSLTYYVSLTTTSLPGPDMPFQARQHCMIKADKNTILVVGGRDDSAFVYFDTTWMFNVKSMAWTQTAATLDKGRRDFACGRVFDSNTDTIYIVVTGGEVSNGVLTSTTEMIKIEKDLERELSEEDFSTWEPGPDFPFQAYMMAGTSNFRSKEADCCWRPLWQEYFPVRHFPASVLEPGLQMDTA